MIIYYNDIILLWYYIIIILYYYNIILLWYYIIIIIYYYDVILLVNYIYLLSLYYSRIHSFKYQQWLFKDLFEDDNMCDLLSCCNLNWQCNIYVQYNLKYITWKCWKYIVKLLLYKKLSQGPVYTFHVSPKFIQRGNIFDTSLNSKLEEFQFWCYLHAQ